MADLRVWKRSDIRLTCHCRGTASLYQVPTPALPLQAFFTFSPIHAALIGSPLLLLAHIPSTLTHSATTTSIETSEGGNIGRSGKIALDGSGLLTPDNGVEKPWCESFFCKTCGGTLYLTQGNANSSTSHEILLCVGSTDLTPKDEISQSSSFESLYKVQGHIGIQESHFKGFSDIIIDGLPRYPQGGPAGILWAEPVAPRTQEGEELHGGCACGGVTFHIRHPKTVPEDDLTTRGWIKPTAKGQRLCANICFCNTCREVSGALGWVWMFTPRTILNVSYAGGEVGVGQAGNAHGMYHSSAKKGNPELTRHWCRRCGCSVFYQAPSGNGGNEMWDVALGCLNAVGKAGDGWRDWVITKFGEGEAETRKRDDWDQRRVDVYIGQWLDGEMSYECDGLNFWAPFVEMVRRGVREVGW
ncbi:hypothetical protein DFH27DRAFT_584081 [Peziza echinospora]|nr:hypothetical protein DFH27DRAFT_584081 [Peziza echinospora]